MFISYTNITHRHSQKGFTLVEMIVSLGIFAVVAVVALGALVNIVSANKKAQSIQNAVTNINFALESISRDMCVGGRYHCEQTFNGTYTQSGELSFSDCNPGFNNQLLAFESSRTATDGGGDTCYLTTVYAFTPDTTAGEWVLSRADQENCNETLGAGGARPFVPIISPTNVKITDFDISVTPVEYPVAYIRIGGYAGVRQRERTEFMVQTAVSPRLLPGN